MINYSKLENLINVVPQHFYPAFLGELVSIFGLSILDDNLDLLTDEAIAAGEHCYGYEVEEGTGGWYHAFRNAAEKTQCIDIFYRYNKLSWQDSDYFDDMISQRLKILTKNDFNAYYKFCIDHNGE